MMRRSSHSKPLKTVLSSGISVPFRRLGVGWGGSIRRNNTSGVHLPSSNRGFGHFSSGRRSVPLTNLFPDMNLDSLHWRTPQRPFSILTVERASRFTPLNLPPDIVGYNSDQRQEGHRLEPTPEETSARSSRCLSSLNRKAANGSAIESRDKSTYGEVRTLLYQLQL